MKIHSFLFIKCSNIFTQEEKAIDLHTVKIKDIILTSKIIFHNFWYNKR